MKKLLLIFSLLLVCMADTAVAQEELAMMSGVVLDEHNKLVPGAIIKLTRKKVASEVRVGEDGMYYSRLMETGSYYVDIYVHKRFYTAKKVALAAPGEQTLYYNFKLKSDGSAEMYTDEYEPLERIKAAGERVPQGGK